MTSPTQQQRTASATLAAAHAITTPACAAAGDSTADTHARWPNPRPTRGPDLRVDAADTHGAISTSDALSTGARGHPKATSPDHRVYAVSVSQIWMNRPFGLLAAI